ncbi:MAG: hypothetical protein GC160_13910 [Acidobacteria bacterium]|nr:hypothetical protein [Acidobacteriota bacterium]
MAGHFVAEGRLSRRFFVRRNYREGVSTIQRLAALDQLGDRKAVAKYHLRELLMAFARYLLPHYAHIYDRPTEQIRMLAARRMAYSAGILRGLWDGEPLEKQTAAPVAPPSSPSGSFS